MSDGVRRLTLLKSFASKTVCARGWRILNISDEDSSSTNLSSLYENICSHLYDPLEPFEPAPEDENAPLKAEIGSTQTGGDFRSLPLTVFVGEASL